MTSPMPRIAASRPAASGVWYRSSSISASCTTAASSRRAGSSRPYVSSTLSKEHRSWWCPSSTPRMSKGVPPRRVAVSASGAKANVASGSTKRRISQAQAVRSTWQRGLVTHSTGPPRQCGPDSGLQLFERGAHRQFGGFPAGRPEEVAPPLQPEGPLQETDPLKRLFRHGSLRAARTGCPGQLAGRFGNSGVAAVRVLSEAVHQEPVLGRAETPGLPQQGTAVPLLDLLGEPL